MLHGLRKALRMLGLAGLALAGLAFCLAFANVLNTGPVNLARTRDVFLAACACLLLYAMAGSKPGAEAARLLRLCRAWLNDPKAFGCAAAVVLVLYVADAATQHLAFRTASHDFSMLDEALYHTTRGRLLFSPVLGRSFFSEHFSPILLVLALPHRLFNSAWFLVLLQPVLLWSAIFPFRALLKGSCRLERWQVNLLAILFLNHAVMISTLEYLFHMECLLPVLLLSTILCGERRRYPLYAACLIATLSIKEDIGLYVCGLGLFYAVFRKRRVLGLLTLALGIVWTALAVKCVIPLFSESTAVYPFTSRWQSWGTRPAEIVVGFLAHPIRLAKRLLNPGVLILLLSLAFVPLLRPRKGYWALFLVPWLVNATSDSHLQSGLKLYYGIPILTFMLAGVILALRDGAVAWPARARYGAALAVLLVLLNGCHYELPHIPRVRGALLRDIARIPQDTPVTASACLFPVLGYERQKALLVSMSVPATPVVLLKLGEQSWPLSETQSYTFAELCRAHGYVAYWRHGDFVGLKKGEHRDED